MRKQLIKYWIEWHWLKFIGAPEYTYTWQRSAYRVLKSDIEIEVMRKQVELLFKYIFTKLELDFDQYKRYISFKNEIIENEIIKIRQNNCPVS